MGLRLVRAWVGVGWTSAVCGLTFCLRACAYVRAYVCAWVRAVYPLVARARARVYLCSALGFGGLRSGFLLVRACAYVRAYVCACVRAVIPLVVRARMRAFIFCSALGSAVCGLAYA